MTNPSLTSEFTISRSHKTNRTSPAHWIWSHTARYWWILLIIIIGATGNASLAAMVPIYIGEAFDAITAALPQTERLLPLTLLIIGSQLLRALLQLGRNFGADLIAQKLERNIRDELYISLLGKSMTFHNIQPVGDTMARATNDVREINFMYSPGVNLVVGSFLFMVMPFYFAPRYHISLLLVPTLFTITYFIALWEYLHSLSPVTDAVRSAFGKLNTRLAEALDGIETVKGAAQEEAEVSFFNKQARRVRDTFVKQGDLEARFVPMLLYGLALGGGLLHALILYSQGEIKIGAVIAYVGLLEMLQFPTFASTFAYTQVSLGMSSARRILELLNSETLLDQNADGYAANMRGEVCFRSTAFAYNPGDDVLNDISFTVSPGQTVAIVGQTGAGKTSLVKLLNRTYETTEGEVLVDGVNVHDWNLASLRQQISIIEQDIFLFSDSIAENIAFGKPNASQEEIIAAAKAAQAHGFITSFEEGYETTLGERGVTLSGGQRQRLALARAFLTDPRILVLDDSTSAIDSATEDHIQRAIAAAAKGRTTFLITHRLSQIRWADLIVVLKNGHIAAIGNHDQLMKTSEAYRRIFSE
ncbi:MAG: ABC transporter ATP-binding protein [Anaerolineae bacterium]|jgi:ATP-binding cassette, subfamily B, bacterial|nr:ABC transporter ATP-binding protein [Anaerolineae bacterium]MBT7073198.1 ABC transporter ATP-binding protein [Anaerolineae bacterium]MBT7326457.1 ABC transporter ATP-binding protein [Anaerolineae bacterium]